MMKRDKWEQKSNSWLYLIFTVASIFLIVAGILQLKQEEILGKNQALTRLKTKTEFIARQIETWRSEKLSEKNEIVQNPFLQNALSNWTIHNDNAKLGNEISDYLHSILRNDQECAEIFITDTLGKVLLSRGNETNSPKPIQMTPISFKGNNAVFGDLYKNAEDGKIYIELSFPINKSISKIVAVCVFRLNAEIKLYPILRSWPFDNTSEESFLYKQVGDSILFLSDLKKNKNAACSFKIPLAKENNPAAKAILQGPGLYSGIGYHDQQIMEYIQRVKYSNWLLASKIDHDELFAPVYRKVEITITVFVLIFAVAAFLVLMIVAYRRKHFYKQLLENERRELALKSHYEFVLKFANDIILLEDEEFNIVEANQRAEQAYQHSREELLKMKIIDLVAPEEKVFAPNRLNQISENEGYNIESIHLRKDGSNFNVEISARIITIDGKSYFHQIIRDITERKQVEIALRESEQRFRTTLYSTGDAIITTDTRGKITHLNRVAEELTGWTEEDASGKFIREVFQIFKEDTLEELENPVEKVLRSEMVVLLSNHTILKGKDGSEIPIGDSGAPIRNSEGKITGVVLVFRDQIKERIAQKALEESERHFQSLANNAPVGIFRTRTDGYTTYVNPPWCELSGLSAEQALGDGWLAAVHPTDRENLAKEWREATKNKQVFHAEYRFLQSDGTIVYVIGHSVPEINSENQITGYIGTITDITERKQAEKQLNLFRTLIDGSNDSFEIFDPETGQLVDVNERGCSDLGYTREEMLSLSVFDIDPKVDDPIFQDIKEALLKSGDITWEGIHLRKDGTTFPVEVNIRLVKLDRSYMVSVARDITSRKLAEEEIIQSEMKFRDIFTYAPMGIYQSNWDGSFIIVNKQLVHILGYDSPEELMTKNLETGVYFSQRDRDELIAKHKTQGSAQNVDVRWKRKDGTPVWIGLSSHAIKNDKGETLYFEGFVQDNTKRRNAEQNLRLLSRSVERNPASIVITNAKGIIEYVNPQFTEVTGYTPVEVLEKNPNILKSGYQSSEFYHNLWELISSGQIWSGEILNKRKNGVLYWENMLISPVEDNSGKITHYVGVKEDITQRKRMEATREILASISNAVLQTEGLEAFFDFVFSVLGEFTTTKNFYIALYNEETQMATVPFKTDEKVMDLNEFPVDRTLTGYVIKSKKSLFTDGIRCVELIESGELEIAGAPTEVWLGVPLFHNGKVIGVMVLQNYEGEPMLKEDDLRLLEEVAPQISLAFERKKIIEDLKIALEKSQEADRLKSAFLATMTHELRTPLNAVIGFSGLIDEEMHMDEIMQFSRIIHESGNNLLEIVEGILDLTLLESGQMNINLTHFSSSVLMTSLDIFIKEEIVKRGKQHLQLIRIPGEDDAPVQIYSDQDKLIQVMVHLLKNALKFTTSGKIEYGFVPDPDGNSNLIRFFVKDTGIGISPDYQSIIFERFRQVDDTLSRKFGGAGIGLTISKKIIELLGSKIGIESSNSEGSTFYFTLPIHENELLIQSRQDTPVPKNELVPFSKQTILVAEDEESNYKYLHAVLTQYNLQVIHAWDGLEAVNRCSDCPEIELVLMDIQMPNMNGLDATKNIKAAKPELPVIALTAFAMQGDRERVLAEGCDEYLEKPVRQDKLIEMIRNFLM